MFKRANENGYSIPAFNFANLEQLQAILNASHEANSDVILQISESARNYIGKETLPLMIKGAILDLRAKGSKIEVALNLDHLKRISIPIRKRLWSLFKRVEWTLWRLRLEQLMVHISLNLKRTQN